jgi:hypothetical protein
MIYVLKLTVSHVPELTQYVPNLTAYLNVPNIEQSRLFYHRRYMV